MNIAKFAQAKRAEVLRDHDRETAYRLGEATMKAVREQGGDEEIDETPFVPVENRGGGVMKTPLAIRHLGLNFILMVKVNEHNTANFARVRPRSYIEYPFEPKDLAEADQEVVDAFTSVAQAVGVDVDTLEPVPASASAQVTDTLDIFGGK
jgi:hypothetical protein